MSHFTMVKTCIRDLDCLKLTLDDLQYEYQEGDLFVSNLLGDKMPVSLLIPIVELFGEFLLGIGFQKHESEYQIVGDWEGIELFSDFEEEETINQITQCYAYNKVMKEKNRLLQKGFVLAGKPEFTEENVAVITLRRY